MIARSSNAGLKREAVHLIDRSLVTISWGRLVVIFGRRWAGAAEDDHQPTSANLVAQHKVPGAAQEGGLDSVTPAPLRSGAVQPPTSNKLVPSQLDLGTPNLYDHHASPVPIDTPPTHPKDPPKCLGQRQNAIHGLPGVSRAVEQAATLSGGLPLSVVGAFAGLHTTKNSYHGEIDR